jgi:hypothetical protein
MVKCRKCGKNFDRLYQGEYTGLLAETCDSCLKKITGRVSYKMFREIYNALKEEPDKVLELVHTNIDRRNGYGSYTNAEAARESLDYLKAEVE